LKKAWVTEGGRDENRNECYTKSRHHRSKGGRRKKEKSTYLTALHQEVGGVLGGKVFTVVGGGEKELGSLRSSKTGRLPVQN